MSANIGLVPLKDVDLPSRPDGWLLSEEERRQAIEDLCSLASQDCTVMYQPGEKPIEGICPVEGCGVEMTRYYP